MTAVAREANLHRVVLRNKNLGRVSVVPEVLQLLQTLRITRRSRPVEKNGYIEVSRPKQSSER